MPRRFVSASSQYLSLASALGSATLPFTVACWYHARVRSGAGIIFSYGSTTVAQSHTMAVGTTSLQVGTQNAGSGTASFTPPLPLHLDRWNHGVGVWRSATDRQAYWNGLPGAVNATSKTPSVDRTLIGARMLTGVVSSYFDGDVADLGVWSVALTDEEIRSLASGVHPTRVRRASLLWVSDLMGRTPDESSLVGSANTFTNSGSVGAPPRVQSRPTSIPFLQSAITMNVIGAKLGLYGGVFDLSQLTGQDTGTGRLGQRWMQPHVNRHSPRY